METFPTLHQEEDPRYPGSDVENDELLCLEGPLSPEDETLERPKALTEKPKSEKGFRMNGKNFILTFPQCDVKKEVAAERLEQKWKDELKGYIVCEEKHADGSPHLHVFLTFDKRKNFKDKNCFDFIGGKHGDYKVCKSVAGSVKYVTKDGNYIAKGVDVESYKKKGDKISDRIAKSIHEGKSVASLAEEEPGYVMIHKRKIEEYEAWVKCEKAKKQKLERVAPSLDGLTDTNLQIAKWICSNIRQPRAFKAPQLYIHGPRNLGKTSTVS